MTSKEALRELLQQALFINPNTEIKKEINSNMFKYREIIWQDLERLEQLDNFITWLRGTTFRKTDEIDKIFKKLKEVLGEYE